MREKKPLELGQKAERVSGRQPERKGQRKLWTDPRCGEKL
jgi:hypothetical protein